MSGAKPVDSAILARNAKLNGQVVNMLTTDRRGGSLLAAVLAPRPLILV